MLWEIIIICVSLLVGFSSHYVFRLKSDNPVEQISESVIKKYTNIDVDLTPEIKENADIIECEEKDEKCPKTL